MSFGRVLILLGVALIVAGLVSIGWEKLGLGRLPGDLSWQRKGWSIHVPLTTSILLSLVLTLLLYLFRR